MTVRSIKLITIVLVIVGAITMILPGNRSMAGDEYSMTSTGLGSAETLMSRYQQWESESLKKSGDGNLILPLAPSNTFSTEKAEARGEAKINLTDGTVAVEVSGLARSEGWDVWIVDNLSGSGLSVLPETGDSMIKLGSLSHDEDRARLNMTLDRALLGAVDPDLVVITRAGKSPAENRVLSGSLTLFQELYLSKMQGHFGTLSDNNTDQPASEEKGVFARLSDQLGLTASAQIGPIPNPTTAAEQLITEGRNSFLNETFQGNGRTCATCHREEENFTISPQFIATLPIQDPLFVSETQPALSRNFENSFLLRTFALIKVNVDGFDNLENKFVFRSTQHTLAMLQSALTPNPIESCAGPDTATERTGWSGDGAPVGVFTLSDGVIHNAQGTLKDFMIGAIIQHYPRTLARRPRTDPNQPFDSFDFRLPTQAELNALEAFQKSLGRGEDPDLTRLQLKGDSPSNGQVLFDNPFAGRCSTCHLNGGAGALLINPGGGNLIANENRNTGVENIPNRPTDENGVPIPRDGGFGSRPDGACGPPQSGLCPTNGCGDGTFNVQVVIEAADTGPFFHNNAVNTIEEAVAFYTSDAFNNSPAGGIIPGPIHLSPTDVTDIAAFLRVLNTLENLRSAADLMKRAKTANLQQGRELIRLAISELNDALEVLSGGNLHPEAQRRLSQALTLSQRALNETKLDDRKELLDESLERMHEAVNDMVAVNVSAFQF